MLTSEQRRQYYKKDESSSRCHYCNKRWKGGHVWVNISIPCFQQPKDHFCLRFLCEECYKPFDNDYDILEAMRDAEDRVSNNVS